METVQTNINMYVYVKLKESGYKILREHNAELNNKIMKFGGKGVPYEDPDVDEEGWTKYQMWELMKIFGSSIMLGVETPFETTIKMEVYDGNPLKATEDS